EELQRLLHRQIQNLMNVLALVANLEQRRFVTRAPAFFAGKFDVSQELHFHRYSSIALASFATSARNVEREVSGAVAALLRFRQRGEELADRVEGLDVGHGIRAWSTPNWRLIHQDYFLNQLSTFEPLEESG